MVQAVSIENGTGSANVHHDTAMETETPTLTTLPPPDANWQISLKDKVIAITGSVVGGEYPKALLLTFVLEQIAALVLGLQKSFSPTRLRWCILSI